jgi:hypothetical protein
MNDISTVTAGSVTVALQWQYRHGEFIANYSGIAVLASGFVPAESVRVPVTIKWRTKQPIRLNDLNPSQQ